jgi:peptide deformylase
MAILKIATLGNPVLRTAARPLAREELQSATTQRFIDDLVETMFDANGAGISATQVYQPVAICVVCVKDNPRYPYMPSVPLTILVNPALEPLTDETFDNYEGCLSVPNLRGVVSRVARVRLRAWDRAGQAFESEIQGLTAGTFQHEIDHLDGKLFVDRVRDTTTLSTWQDFERHHMGAWVDRARAIVAKYGS